MASSIDLRSAENTRLELTQEQQREIERMYKRISQRIGKEADNLPNTTSGALRKMYLKQLQKQINSELGSLGKNLESTINENMLAADGAVVSDNVAFNKALGFSIQGMFSHVPGDVVKTVATGQLYEGRWSLSQSIWGHTAKTKKDINTIIAEGIAQNKSAYDIAKDLERYVNPSARKPWDWSKVYPGTALKVDYNAQRLARTMVSHAYQQSFVRTTQKNPFVSKYKWISSNSGRVCELCNSRDGVLFEKDELPLDHPNGMCTFVAVTDSMVDIADRLGDWAHGKEDPELEEYAKDLYGDAWKSAPSTKPEYRYHATRSSSIVGIIENGLKPNRGMYGKGVYFAQSSEDALEWTAETSTGGKTVLRVALDYLNSNEYQEFSAAEDAYGMAQGWVTTKVPFDKIEIKVGDDEWWTLSEYAKQRKNIVYNRLSPAAQKRVDKQWSKETEEWLKKRAQNN